MAESVTLHPVMQEGNGIRPQSLLFTLYGDYIYERGDRITIRSLIKLLALFGISEQAVRTTVSRMTQRGWLAVERTGNTSRYIFTRRAQEVIQDGRARIFDAPRTAEPWNHYWHLVTYFIPEEHRRARDQFRRELSWLGYGMLTNTVWVSPRNQQPAVERLAARLEIQTFVQMFRAESEGFMSSDALVTRCWDLGALNADYCTFIAHHAPAAFYRAESDANGKPDEGECFARRVLLIHQYRKFPYRDPYLPLELLPRDWRGWEAAALFRECHDLLAPGANQFFDKVYS
jgi:phenylacetic acid degradation operon negative regulatory protein